MDGFPVDAIDQDSAALYVAAVIKQSMDIHPSCDLCRHAFRLWATCNTTKCTKHKGVLQSALASVLLALIAEVNLDQKRCTMSNP